MKRSLLSERQFWPVLVSALLGAAVLAFAVTVVFVTRVRAAAPSTPVHAVYHLDNGIAQATAALRNIRNQLEIDPDAKIIVVGIGTGIDFMLDGSQTAGGYPFALLIQDLRSRGVRFEACGNTLINRKLDSGQLMQGVVVVPSGMAELARLQFREHYAYLKP